MLEAVTAREEIARYDAELRGQIERALPNRTRMHVGYQGGGGRQQVLHDGYFWYARRVLPNAPIPRYWNAFGLAFVTRLNRGIIVEVNPPISGFSTQLSGLFAKDSRGRVSLLHTGRVAGGRPGIGKAAFKEFYKEPWTKVRCERDEPIDAVPIGYLKEKSFVERLRAFVEEVNRFKEHTQVSTEDLRAADDDHQGLLEADKSIGKVEREQLIMARIGQGWFRRNVERVEKACRVTGVTLKEHLRASHIKPWAKSSPAEKLDGNNGLLLAPHVDHLFDRGYISFADDGRLITSSKMDKKTMTLWHLVGKMTPTEFTPAQRRFLTHHRKYVFRSS